MNDLDVIDVIVCPFCGFNYDPVMMATHRRCARISQVPLPEYMGAGCCEYCGHMKDVAPMNDPEFEDDDIPRKFHYEVKFNLLINGAVVGSVSVDASSVNSYSAAEFGATVIQHEIVIKPVSYSMPKLDSKDVPYE